MRSLVRAVTAVASSFALLLAVTTVLSAHAVVFPPEAPTGAYQKYVLRVPNERAFSTTEVTITFPSGVRVISFDDVPGWTLEPSPAGEGAYAAATWSGTLGVGRFVEFGFIGVNPAEPTTLEWDVVQTYGDGTEVAWTGPVESATPASVTRVIEPAEPTEAAPSPSSSLGTVLGGAALLVALLSLGLALRAPKA